MKQLAFILITLLAFSCSPEKRLAKLLKHHPELVSDTLITVYDTLQIPGHRTDTVVKWSGRQDTITITKNNVTTKLIVHRDSIFISQVSKPQTIIKTVTVPVTRIIYEQVTKSVWTRFWIGLCTGLGLVLAVIALAYFVHRR